jgi:hypothetical protein
MICFVLHSVASFQSARKDVCNPSKDGSIATFAIPTFQFHTGVRKRGQRANLDISLSLHCASDKGSQALWQFGILLGSGRSPQELTHVSCARVVVQVILENRVPSGNSSLLSVNFCTLTPFRTEEHFTAGNVLFYSAASTFLVEELQVHTFPTGRRRGGHEMPHGNRHYLSSRS